MKQINFTATDEGGNGEGVQSPEVVGAVHRGADLVRGTVELTPEAQEVKERFESWLDNMDNTTRQRLKKHIRFHGENLEFDMSIDEGYSRKVNIPLPIQIQKNGCIGVSKLDFKALCSLIEGNNDFPEILCSLIEDNNGFPEILCSLIEDNNGFPKIGGVQAYNFLVTVLGLATERQFILGGDTIFYHCIIVNDGVFLR